ncbi:MAG: hypothetical protein QOK11_1951 [Pseudonocardiales bacterium]|nr:hypothetical protein [Pseudonocardiales bacterium]
MTTLGGVDQNAAYWAAFCLGCGHSPCEAGRRGACLAGELAALKRVNYRPRRSVVERSRA